MENNTENIRFAKLKELVFSKRFLKPLISAGIGALLGFLYYYFIGCTSGQCAITSNPYMSMIWGGLIGYFLVNSPCAGGKC